MISNGGLKSVTTKTIGTTVILRNLFHINGLVPLAGARQCINSSTSGHEACMLQYSARYDARKHDSHDASDAARVRGG